MNIMNLRPLVACAALLCAGPVFAQDAAPAEELPPAAEAPLPPAGEAPVDEIAPISDVAPDGGAPDATSTALACTFTTECVDNECADSGYEGQLTVITDGAGLAEAEWADPSETVAMSAILENGTTLATSTESGPAKQRLLTVLADGQARFTTHLTDPLMAITYVGQCE
ncbi:hypothetical protein [Paracoccus albus]|uniref:hypothetical protein n=1 Tax=Paracoccus albus TaxID=3017784 RepID=UPI0022F0BC0D|nr:hypothetical protein [Paracoccus albus]WBU59344.1 hypothetical protein PAF20_11245 [Paracoccus albus]